MTLLTAANFKIKNPSDVNIKKFNQSLAYLQKSPPASSAVERTIATKKRYGCDPQAEF
jgi:hypothetical protein